MWSTRISDYHVQKFGLSDFAIKNDLKRRNTILEDWEPLKSQNNDFKWLFDGNWISVGGPNGA